ncbi:hypothetical protein V3C99_010251, partial [Haemonchus contortus]
SRMRLLSILLLLISFLAVSPDYNRQYVPPPPPLSFPRRGSGRTRG